MRRWLQHLASRVDRFTSELVFGKMARHLGNDRMRQILRSVCRRLKFLDDRTFRAMITMAASRQIGDGIANCTDEESKKRDRRSETA
jgi:hypothetical protein